MIERQAKPREHADSRGGGGGGGDYTYKWSETLLQYNHEWADDILLYYTHGRWVYSIILWCYLPLRVLKETTYNPRSKRIIYYTRLKVVATEFLNGVHIVLLVLQ